MRNLFQKNKMLEAIKNGRAPIGFFNYIKDTTILDVAGTVGFDFAIIDGEHAVMDRETIEHMILAAQVNDVVPLIRVPDIIPYLMRNYMEMGALGILVPHVTTGAECKKGQDALRYPPYGTASCCRSIHSDGYRPANWMDYLDFVQENVSYIPMIEDPLGVENLDEILSELQPGRDMIMFGKADYGQALGTLNRDGSINPAVNEAYIKTMEKCREYNIGFMACPQTSPGGQTAADVQKVIDEGCSAVVLNTDQMTLADAFRNVVSKCMDMKIQ